MSDDLGDIDVFDVLERLGVENVASASGGQEASFSCPFHSDERPSAYMNTESGLAFCHSCHERHNLAGFVARVAGVSYATATGWLRDAYGVDFREPEGGSMAAEIGARFSTGPSAQRLRRPRDSWVTTFMGDLYSEVGSRAYEYAVGRGFTPHTLSTWQFGYDSSSDRLVVPVRGPHGELLGFKGRRLDEEVQPKFLILGDYRSEHYGFDPYEASQVVFGLDRRPELGRRVSDDGVVVLCESEYDAVALRQMGVMRVGAIGMSYLTDEHARQLVCAAREVVLFFDPDQAGRDAATGHESSDGRRAIGAIEKLQPYVIVRVVEGHDRDPAQMLEDGDDALALELIERAPATVASLALSR